VTGNIEVIFVIGSEKSIR